MTHEEKMNKIEEYFNSITNEQFEQLRIKYGLAKSETDTETDLNGWHKVSDGFPKHSRAVAISPAFNGNEFACYNDYEKCWDTEDGDDFLCALDEVTYWYEIPEAPRG